MPRAGNAGAWPPSAQVTTTVDRTPPQAALALSENSPYAHISGDWVYYNPADGVFTVTATMTDTPAGLQQVVFPATVSAGGSYPLNGASSATVSHSYAFTPSSTESGLDFPVTVSDRAGNVVTATFDVERDATAPAVTVNVPARIYTATIPVSWTVSELGAGASGVYTVSVMTDTGPLQLWLSGVTSTSASLAGELGHRYTFVVTTTDNVSNVGQGTAEAVATQVTKYYYIGSSRVAMRQGSEVTYLHADHLGTVGIATNASGQVLARTLNMPYGSVRWASGTMPTDYGFTGMKDTGLGLVYMHARYYASYLNRWIQPDTIVPDPANPQSLNRFSYVLNNPIKYTDPTGHFSEEEIMTLFRVGNWDEAKAFFEEGGLLEGKWGWLEVLRQARWNDVITFDDAPGTQAVFSAQLAEMRLLRPGYESELVSAVEVGRRYDDYRLEKRSLEDGHVEEVLTTDAWTRHDKIRLNWSQFDPFGAVVDAMGALTAGAGDEVVNYLANVLDISYGSTEFAVEYVSGDASASDVFGVATDVVGLFGGPLWDIIGIVFNIAGVVEYGP